MNIRYLKNKNTLTFYIYGELDEYSKEDAKIILDKLILSDLNIKEVVFDLSGVTFMDSTGIGLLIGRYKKLKDFNIKTYISGASVATEKVIQISGLYSIMPRI